MTGFAIIAGIIVAFFVIWGVFGGIDSPEIDPEILKEYGPDNPNGERL